MQFYIVITLVCVFCEIAYHARANLGTLRTFQAAACDDDVIQMRCPAGTRIAVELARYGRVGNQRHVCPAVDKATDAILKAGTCLLPTAQQAVVALCQTKVECHFLTNASVLKGDPCPGARKYVEVAYKCRPYEFRSRLVCQDQRMRLACNANSRIAIFTAIFGRSKDDKSLCAFGNGDQPENCFASYATQTAMQACHGRRACELPANALTFGQPCKSTTRVYLKVIYTCVPRKVLNKQYEARVVEFTDVQMAPVDKHAPHATNDLGSDQVYFNAKRSTTTASTMLQKDTSAILDVNCTVQSDSKPNQVIGFLSQWINTYTFVAQNQERFYLYLILSLGAGVLLSMGLLIAYLLVQRGRARREAKYRTASYGGGGGGSILPHGFADDISVVDADIDLDLPIVPMRPFSNVVLNADSANYVRSTTASAPYEMPRGCQTLPKDMPRSLNAGGGANNSFFYG